MAKTKSVPVTPAVNEDEPLSDVEIVRVAIPRDIYTHYAALADSQGVTIAELLAHRLQRCVDHSSIRSLYFTDSQRAQLERLLQKRLIDNSEQALALVTAALSIRVGDYPPVPITAQQAKRLAMGVLGGQTPESRVQTIVQQAITRAVGI